MAEDSHIQIQQYSHADIRRVLVLLSTVFGYERSEKHWKWRYEQYPVQFSPDLRTPFATLGVDTSSGNEIVAHFATSPAYINCAGSRLIGGQAGDFAVHPDHQGQGLLIRTATENLRVLRESGVHLIYSFPNQNSLPGLVRRLGWNRIFQLFEYTLRLRVGAIPLWPLVLTGRMPQGVMLWRALRNRQLDFAASANLPADVEAFWREASGYEIYSVWKDERYLRWRYEDNPNRRFTYFTLREQGRMVALAIGTLAGSGFVLLEFLCSRKDIAVGQTLVQRILGWSVRNSIASLNFTGRDDVFFDSVFRGFERVPSPLVFCVKTLDPNETSYREHLPGNWTVTGGDLDAL